MSRHLKQVVTVFDPHRDQLASEAGINPIGGVGGFVGTTKSSCMDRAKHVAKCLKPEEAGNDNGYFEDTGRALVTRAIVHVASSPEFEGRRTLGTLRDLLLEGDVETLEQMKELD